MKTNFKMKKLIKTILFALGVAFTLFIVSCDKQRYCECTGRHLVTTSVSGILPPTGQPVTSRVTVDMGEVDTTFMVKREKDCGGFIELQERDSSNIHIEDMKQYSCDIK